MRKLKSVLNSVHVLEVTLLDRGFTATVQLRLKRRFTELLLSTVQHQCVDEIYYL